MSREDIQAIDNALNDLREAVGLPQRDQRRPNAAVSLRRAGFTTSQIVTLSRGNWPRQTVDRWVEGAAMPPSAPAERAVEIIAEGVARNQTLDHLLEGLNVQVQLAAEGATVESVLAVMKQLKDEGILLSDFIEHYKMMKATGLQFANVKRHLDYRHPTDRYGCS
jgi:hypothetical protein